MQLKMIEAYADSKKQFAKQAKDKDMTLRAYFKYLVDLGKKV